jgi:hypothetical protein
MVIASPSRLDDGTPFPSLFWLTCPWLAERVSALESGGGAAQWARRVSEDPVLADAVKAADAAVRALRSDESRGEDECANVVLAGQSDPLGVKCLHAHVALALAGVPDLIGEEVVSDIRLGSAAPGEREGRGVEGQTAAWEEQLMCPDVRCLRRTA